MMPDKFLARVFVTNKCVARTTTFLVAILLAFVSLTLGCSQNPRSKVADRSAELSGRLTPAAPAPVTEISAIRQSVYVDSSLSMQGFVGEGSAGGRSTFDEFLDSMPGVMPGCEVFRYGNSASSEEQSPKIEDVTTRVQFDHDLHDRNLYRRGFNPDDVLISGLSAQKEPTLSILITDGVESDSKGQVNTAVVSSIRNWMNHGGTFAILVMKSKFSGKLYSEQQRRMLENKEVDARPFYAFVLSPSVRDFEDLQEKLKRRFPQLKSLVFSDDSITCHPGMPVGASYADEAPPDKPYYWQMLTAENLREGIEDQLTYHFSYEIKSTYPVRLLGIRTASKLYRWNGSQSQFEGEGTITESQPAVESGEAAIDGNVKTQIFLLRPRQVLLQGAQDDYRFFSIEQFVYIKEIDRDIGELTTTDDSTTDTAEKTYRFQELLYALMDVHLKDRLLSRMSPRLYITVANQ
jgi:hypothetical protein